MYLSRFACELELPCLGLRCCLRGLRAALRVLVIRRTDGTIALQRVKTPPIRVGLARMRLGGEHFLSRGLLSEPVIGIVEHREHVVLLYRLADVDSTLHDLAADAKRLVDLMTRLHRSYVAIRLLRLVVAQLNGADGSRRLRRRLVRRACAQHRSDRHGDKCCSERCSHGDFLASISRFHELGE